MDDAQSPAQILPARELIKLLTINLLIQFKNYRGWCKCKKCNPTTRAFEFEPFNMACQQINVAHTFILCKLWIGITTSVNAHVHPHRNLEELQVYTWQACSPLQGMRIWFTFDTVKFDFIQLFHQELAEQMIDEFLFLGRRDVPFHVQVEWIRWFTPFLCKIDLQNQGS